MPFLVQVLSEDKKCWQWKVGDFLLPRCDGKAHLRLALALASEELHLSPRFILLRGIVSVELPSVSAFMGQG